METRHISFEHTRLAVHVAGQGPLAVLLHGFPLDSRMWLDLMTSPRLAGRAMAAIDLRGHGGSPWCGDAAHGMDLLANDVAAVIRTLCDGTVDVVGLSMGGYVAQALYAEHPDLVCSLALVDTKALGDTTEQKAAREAAIATVTDQGRAVFATPMLEKLLAPRPADDPHGQLLRACMRTMMEGQAVETIVADLRGMRDRPDRSPALAAARVPVLVVVGEHDALTPPDGSRAMAGAIPGARFAVIPDAGHMSPMENPGEFARVLAGFWDARE